jgi:hypothetical protein
MDDIIESVSDSSIFKNVWYVDNPISDSPCYVFAKRNYDTDDDGIADESDIDWIGPFEVIPLDMNGSFLTIESHVELPIEKDRCRINDDKELTISIYQMAPNIVPHLDTTYVVENLSGDVKVVDIHNAGELLERTIDLNDYDVGDYEDLIVKVAFRNKNKISSEFAVFYVESYKKGVNILNDVSELRSEIDNILEVDNQDSLTYSIRIATEKGENVFRLDDVNDETILLPKYLLQPEEDYRMQIVVGNRITYDKYFKTSTYSIYNNSNLTTYSMRMRVGEFDFKLSADKCYIEPINENTVFSYDSGENILYFVLFKLGALYYFDTGIKIEEELSDSYISFIHMDNNKIAMVALDTDSSLHVYILNVNITHYSVIIEDKHTFDDLTFDNISVSRVAYSSYYDTLYILGNYDGVIKLLAQKIGGSSYIVGDIPNQDHKEYFVTSCGFNNLTISASGRDDNDELGPIYSYDVKLNTFNVIDVFPEEFENSSLVGAPLPDGNTLYVDSEGNNEDYIIFNNKDLTYTIKDKDENYKHGSKVLITAQGEVFISQDGEDNLWNYFS